MAKYLDALLEKLESRWSLATLVWQTVGAVMSFGIPAWAAHATAWINKFGPIAWVACGFVGLLLFAVFLVLVAVFRERFIAASIRRRFYEKADGVNPLETTFRNQRIYLADIISPIEPTLKNKTFIGCEVIGPVNIGVIASKPGSGGFNGCNFHSCNAVRVRNDTPISTGIMLVDCTFIQCTLFRITLLIPASAYEDLKAKLPPITWLTPEPGA
ncbi:MAG: hypothetical protein ACP5QR_02630 [Rhizomicrobium sp.]